MFVRTNAIDIGLRSRSLGFRVGDTGRILENIVYLELIRRVPKVYVGQHDGREVDFVTSNGGELHYYQVSETVRDENAKSAPAELLDNPQTSRALEILEESAYSEAEMLDYDRYWDQVRRDKALMDDLDEAHAKLDEAEARANAAVEKLRQSARKMKDKGFSAADIADLTGLTASEIDNL